METLHSTRYLWHHASTKPRASPPGLPGTGHSDAPEVVVIRFRTVLDFHNDPCLGVGSNQHEFDDRIITSFDKSGIGGIPARGSMIELRVKVFLADSDKFQTSISPGESQVPTCEPTGRYQEWHLVQSCLAVT